MIIPEFALAHICCSQRARGKNVYAFKILIFSGGHGCDIQTTDKGMNLNKLIIYMKYDPVLIR